MQRWTRFGLALLLALATAGALQAQGTTTSTLVGTVTSADGEPLPGVTVTARSPALIGERTTYSGVNGDYIIKSLPPGTYTVTFVLEGLQSVERSATLPLGGTARSDASLEVTAAEETIVVLGEAPSALETTTVGANFTKDVIDQLPITRTPTNIAELSAGLTDNTPLGGQVAINGALAYDNAILINGVNVQDNIFGQTNNLFIDDAIQETQVMTSGISAEFGGFTGGVINTVTKSGGNQFAGSFRVDLDRPEWRDETPFENERGIQREGDVNKTYTATVGGPILRDRLWFFLAGREFSRDIAQTTNVGGQAYTYTQDNPRYEVKLTGSVTPNHSLQASYINNDRKDKNNAQLVPLEIAAVIPDSEFPNEGFSLSYSGVFTNNLFGELRYSEKAFQFKGLGGSSPDIRESPFYSYGILNGLSGLYHAPYFDATDPEDRDNDEWYAALSWFLSTESTGSHDVKFGFDRFTTTRTGGNSQSSTNYVFNTDFLAEDGVPVLGPDGRFIPVFTPGVSALWNFIPTRGAVLDITTDAFFVNDTWALNANWSFNLGLRYEQVRSEATGGINTVDTDTFVPRLGASWDVKGDGRYKVDVTYAQYAGRYNPSVFGRNSPVGNPTGIYSYYVGPAGEGIDFAPGLDPSNYVVYAARVPNANIFFESGLSSPVAEEITASFGTRLGSRGYAKLTYVDRTTDNYIDDFIQIQNGCTEIVIDGESFGCADNVVYDNTDSVHRDYQSIQAQAQYRVTDDWTLAGNWTWQLENDGNYEGEGGQSIGTSPFGNRPEVYPLNRSNPDGHLFNYQEHKVRLWSNYTWDFGSAGNLGLGVLFRYDSPLTFSYIRASQSPTTEMRARNPGYQQLPRFNLYFGDRGAGEFNDVYTFDLALTYNFPIWKVEPWIRFDVRNVLNDDTLVTYNTGIIANTDGPVDEFGLPTTFTRGANFGKGTRNADYSVPREYFIAAGIRF
ncbi:MAG TPA: TonB-dependent receptor [Thermoanaerobaculia bacterium]|nr:TonB-dependent receptor [Thermoanaerobaculia bacterium]